jgi:uracil-DNA glycosylase
MRVASKGVIMADLTPSADARLVRQALERLESLRWAGVEWLALEVMQETISEEGFSRPDRNAATSAAEETVPTAGSMPSSEDRDTARDFSEDSLFNTAEASETMATPEERRTALEVLSRTVSTCTRCPELAATRTQTVFGVGRSGVELCFVGEAPGADEDAQGEPFVGAAGQLLTKIITACGLSRQDVYICNIIKCRPPGNRTPLPNEVANCKEYLDKQLELLRPKFICALGSTAAQNLLGTTQSMGKLRGRFHDYRGIPVVCTYHPAYLLPHRNPGAKKEVWEDMKMLLARMGRPIK